MVRVIDNREAFHEDIRRFWDALTLSMGDNPFSIAAIQGVSLTFHDEDSQLSPDENCYSQFRPDVLAIDIFTTNLNRFWEEMFPGCAPELKYRYACWRELWHFWNHSRFAPLKFTLGEDWLYFLENFSRLSFLQSEYLAQYFAAMATSVIDRDYDKALAFNKVSTFRDDAISTIL